ncbi:MAG: LysR family transcriptional regulator [Verrucomicrobiales bacterium]|nr:LysR family transcriptional regulator [Verrucomicrobiales bacterium]
MELRHLRYFVAVAEERGITRAAARLHVSQPPLSRQMRDLEAEMQIPLFTRGAREVTLTPAGRRFLRDARDILRRVETAMGRARNAAPSTVGGIRVGFSPTPATEILPAGLKRFQKSHPRVPVMLMDLESRELLAGVRSRKLDVAFMIEPPMGSGRVLRFEPLQELPIGILVGREHPLARRRSVTVEEVLGESIVAFTRAGYPDYHLWLRRLVRHARRPAHIVSWVDGATSLMAAVEAGQGIAFGPPVYAVVAGRRAKYLPIVPGVPPVRLGCVLRTGRASPEVTSFVESLRAACAVTPATG